MNETVTIDPNSIAGQLMALLRYLLVTGGSYALGAGLVTEQILQIATLAGTVIIPSFVGIYLTATNRAKLVKIGTGQAVPVIKGSSS